MNKFEKTYISIIKEARFSSSKWVEKDSILSIEVLEYLKHLSEKLSDRYKIELSTWKRWNIIKTQIVLHINKVNLWLKCTKKQPFQKSWTCYLTESNIWISGMIQNDLEDKVQRIYFSTFLPEDPHYNIHDYYFELPL